jgi:uncharacterized membrane protein YphA (DoxX/SURF4 family)
MGDVYLKKTAGKTGTLWDAILLILRVWFGYVMMANGKLFFELFAPTADQKFFDIEFTGNNMAFPLPLIIAFEARAAEFFGGMLIFSGLFTRLGALLVALALLILTLAVNTAQYQGFDDTATVSFSLFAVVFMYWGGGRYAMDSLLKKS